MTDAVFELTRAQLIAELEAASDDTDQPVRLRVTEGDLDAMRSQVAQGDPIYDVLLAWEDRLC